MLASGDVGADAFPPLVDRAVEVSNHLVVYELLQDMVTFSEGG